MESTIQTKQPNQNLCPTMVRRYTMVTPGSPRKQSVSVSILSPASYAMMTSRVQDTQWLRLDPPGNIHTPRQDSARQLRYAFTREKKNHGLRHGGNTRVLHPKNQKSERIISIEWIHDVATKRISSRRHFPYLYFENIYHIVPFQITFKYHTYIKSIIYRIPFFPNRILSKSIVDQIILIQTSII